MKRAAILISVLVAFTLPLQAQFCNPPYQCQAGGTCSSFYQLLGDYNFESNCGFWGYSGTAGLTTAPVCTWPNNHVGYVSAFMYSHGGTIAQTFSTFADGTNNFSLTFTYESTNMQTGDYVDVWIIHNGQWVYLDTLTGNVWCTTKSYSFGSTGWAGQLKQVRFEGHINAAPATMYFDEVGLWQQRN